MLTPRLASWALDLPSFCRTVYRTSVEEYQKLPVQWRGFVLHNHHLQHSCKSVLEMLTRNPDLNKLDPQGVFDAYNGLSPS